MSFALLTDEGHIAWEDGKLTGTPPWAVSEAEDAMRERDWIGATPTGPWFERGTPEHAWLVLRSLAPRAEVGGDPPKLGGYGDELEQGQPVQEAVAVPLHGRVTFDPKLHPRDRLGRWRDVLGFKKLIPKLPHVEVPLERPLAEVFSVDVDAEKWWQDRYPDKAFDFKGADMDVLGPALVQVARLTEKYPFAFRPSAGIVIDRSTDPDDKADRLPRTRTQVSAARTGCCCSARSRGLTWTRCSVTLRLPS